MARNGIQTEEIKCKDCFGAAVVIMVTYRGVRSAYRLRRFGGDTPTVGRMVGLTLTDKRNYRVYLFELTRSSSRQ